MANVGLVGGVVQKGGPAETRNKQVLGGEREGAMLFVRQGG